jgi:hypothetical protein
MLVTRTPTERHPEDYYPTMTPTPVPSCPVATHDPRWDVRCGPDGENFAG